MWSTTSMFGIGSSELILILVILVLLFGSRKIPELAKGLGESVRHLRRAFQDEDKNTTKVVKK